MNMMKKLFILNFGQLPFPAQFDFSMRLSPAAGDTLKAAGAALTTGFDSWPAKRVRRDAADPKKTFLPWKSKESKHVQLPIKTGINHPDV
jgi:hypothetical protein